jgi:hypothetical protein
VKHIQITAVVCLAAAAAFAQDVQFDYNQSTDWKCCIGAMRCPGDAVCSDRGRYLTPRSAANAHA